MQKLSLNKGFTLIELLVVIAILGILAAVVLVAINPAQRIAEARDTEARSNVAQIATAVEACFTQNQGSYANCDTNTKLVNAGFLKQAPSSGTPITPGGTPPETLVYAALTAQSAACDSGSGALKFWVYRTRTGDSRVECLASGTPGTP